jgi:hypothetical protein
MSAPAALIYESPSLRILDMDIPIGIRPTGHVEVSDRASSNWR